jgi:hypothetical protein
LYLDTFKEGPDGGIKIKPEPGKSMLASQRKNSIGVSTPIAVKWWLTTILDTIFSMKII